MAVSEELLQFNSIMIYRAIESGEINSLESLLNNNPVNLTYAYKLIMLPNGSYLTTTPLEHICFKRIDDKNPIFARMHNLVLRLLRMKDLPEFTENSFLCRYAPLVPPEPDPAAQPVLVTNRNSRPIQRPTIVVNGNIIAAPPIPPRRRPSLYVSPPGSPSPEDEDEDEEAYLAAAARLSERSEKGGVRKSKKSRHRRRKTKRRLLR